MGMSADDRLSWLIQEDIRQLACFRGQCRVVRTYIEFNSSMLDFAMSADEEFIVNDADAASGEIFGGMDEIFVAGSFRS